VKRFVFASSMSVYASLSCGRAMKEDDPAAPNDVYGAAKRTVELLGENLSRRKRIDFHALRIARVVGPGIQKTSSPWRSQIFEAEAGAAAIRLPFSPDAQLSLVHVEDVARMLLLLVLTAQVKHVIYNTPAETWVAKELKELIEGIGKIPVELDAGAGHDGGPTCDGSRFTEEFDFRAPSLRERLVVVRGQAAPDKRWG
jgi:nucleoside-diphosphate-sugar epimerase